jgi:hypothetical protein
MFVDEQGLFGIEGLQKPSDWIYLSNTAITKVDSILDNLLNTIQEPEKVSKLSTYV